MRLRMIYIIVLLSLPLVTWARQDSIKQEQKNRHVLSDGSVYIGQMMIWKLSTHGLICIFLKFIQKEVMLMIGLSF